MLELITILISNGLPALQREQQLPPALQNAHVELVQRMLALDSTEARQRLRAVIH